MSDYGPIEAWLRDAAFANPFALLRSLPPGVADLRYSDVVNRIMEYAVPTGKIDLLLLLPHQMVVVEFKRDLADESAVAQVLRYAGSLRATEEHFQQRCDVVSVVVAQRFTPGAVSAAFAASVSLLVAKPTVAYALSKERPQPAALLGDSDLVAFMNPPANLLSMPDLIALVKSHGCDVRVEQDGTTVFSAPEKLPDNLAGIVRMRIDAMGGAVPKTTALHEIDGGSA